VGQEASQHLLPRELPGGEVLGHQKPYPWKTVLSHPFLVGAGGLPWSLFALATFLPGFARGLTLAGRRTFQAMLCWTWVNLLFWSIIPGNSPRHSFPLVPGMAGLAALAWFGWVSGRLYWPWPSLPPGYLLAGLLFAWLLVKLIFVQVVIPIRNDGRAPREKGQQIAARVPREQPLYIFKLKDEGLMFYYSRCPPLGEKDRVVQRLNESNGLPSPSEPVYCMLTEKEWKQWDCGREGEVILHLTDQQNDPILLLRVKPKSVPPP
jgi:hypothetical protein